MRLAPRTSLNLLPLLLAIPCLAQQALIPNMLTSEEKAAGWKLLFDGRTMDGWDDPARRTPPDRSWTIDDGCLKSLPHPRIREDLLTKETFRDFELVFDWLVPPGSNSGVKYRIQDRVFLDSAKAKPGAKSFEEIVGFELDHKLSDRTRLGPAGKGEEYVIGFEYQVIDDVKHPDARRGPKYSAGALYGMVGRSRMAAGPVGTFNHSRLVVEGNHVEHWLNGVKVVDTTLDSKEVSEAIAERWKSVPAVYKLLIERPKSESPIALQHHGDEVWFRSIKVRKLGSR